MKVVTKEYYGKFLIFFRKLCELKNFSNDEFFIVRDKVTALIEKCKYYDILESDNIISQYNIENKFSAVQKEYIITTYNVYRIIVDNLFDITVNGKHNYESYFWASLLKLDFKYYHQLYIITSNYSDDIFLSNVKKSYLKLNQENFDNLRNEYLDVDTIIHNDDKYIEDKLLDRIYKDLLDILSAYRNYIEINYFNIKDSFEFYDKNIRLYPLQPLREKDNQIMIKIMAYYNDGSQKLNIYDRYLTFAMRFGNLEEIQNKISCDTMIISETTKDNIFRDFLSEFHIHREIIQIFIKYASENILFDFIVYLLRLNDYIILSSSSITNSIEVSSSDENLIHYKLHLSKNIERIAYDDRLYESNQTLKHIFLTKPDDRILSNINKDDIIYIDEFYKSNLYSAIHYFIKDNLYKLDIRKSNYYDAEKLINQIRDCPVGKSGWNKFENICIEIFNYLFKDNFRHFLAEEQSWTYENLFRRDYVVNNIPKSNQSFWSDIKTEFNANICTVEFKNYSELLDSNTIFNISKYLISNKNNFILIFTRAGLNESAKKLQIELFKEKKVLIIVFNEKEIIEMLNEKKLDIDVSYRLENVKFEIYKAI